MTHWRTPHRDQMRFFTTLGLFLGMGKKETLIVWLVVIAQAAALIFMITALAHGQDMRGNGMAVGPLIAPADSSFSLMAVEPSVSIGLKGKLIVTIRPDGTIEYGEGYTPDGAAKALWDALGIERKARNCQ